MGTRKRWAAAAAVALAVVVLSVLLGEAEGMEAGMLANIASSNAPAMQYGLSPASLRMGQYVPQVNRVALKAEAQAKMIRAAEAADRRFKRELAQVVKKSKRTASHIETKYHTWIKKHKTLGLLTPKHAVPSNGDPNVWQVISEENNELAKLNKESDRRRHEIFTLQNAEMRREEDATAAEEYTKKHIEEHLKTEAVQDTAEMNGINSIGENGQAHPVMKEYINSFDLNNYHHMVSVLNSLVEELRNSMDVAEGEADTKDDEQVDSLNDLEREMGRISTKVERSSVQ